MDQPLAELSQKVEERKREVIHQTDELAAIERRLQETEARLARVVGGTKGLSLASSPTAVQQAFGDQVSRSQDTVPQSNKTLPNFADQDTRAQAPVEQSSTVYSTYAGYSGFGRPQARSQVTPATAPSQSEYVQEGRGQSSVRDQAQSSTPSNPVVSHTSAPTQSTSQDDRVEDAERDYTHSLNLKRNATQDATVHALDHPQTVIRDASSLSLGRNDSAGRGGSSIAQFGQSQSKSNFNASSEAPTGYGQPQLALDAAPKEASESLQSSTLAGTATGQLHSDVHRKPIGPRQDSLAFARVPGAMPVTPLEDEGSEYMPTR